MTRIRDRLQEVIGQFDEVEAALFTTFNFDPNFFEENVLPTVFGVADMEARTARRQAVHDALAKIPVGVCFDASVARPGLDDYRYTAYPVRLTNAFFHPKNIMLIGIRENRRWLYISAASSNLTLSGWGRNVEGFADVWVHAVTQQPWQATDGFLSWLITHLGLAESHHPIAAFRQLMQIMNLHRTVARDPDNLTAEEIKDRHLYFPYAQSPQGEVVTQNLADMIRSVYRHLGEVKHICVGSPYWSNVAANMADFTSPTWELIPALSQKRVCSGLSIAEESEIQKLFNGAVTLNRWSNEQDDRFRHLKIFQITYPGRVVVSGVGSCNFTNAGLRRSGNVETMLFSQRKLELPERRALKAKELADPGELLEEAPIPPAWSVQVIYDWQSRKCSWRVDIGKLPDKASLEIAGLGTFSLAPRENGNKYWKKGPRKGREFRVLWQEGGEQRSWKGWILELNIDQSTKIYGTPLDPYDILESWRIGGNGKPPKPRDPKGDGDEEDDPITEKTQATLNLFEFYRSVREFEQILKDAPERSHELLIANSNSVFALASAIQDGPEPLPVRYLVLREALRLMDECRHDLAAEKILSHRNELADWLNACRGDLLDLLVKEYPKKNAKALLAWIDDKLGTWEDDQ